MLSQLNIILFLISFIGCFYLMFEDDKYTIILSEPFSYFDTFGIFIILLIPLFSLFYSDLIVRYTEHMSYMVLKCSNLFRFLLTTLSAGISYSFIRVLRMESLHEDQIKLNWFVTLRRKWNNDEFRSYCIKWLESKNIKYSNSELEFIIDCNTSRTMKGLSKCLEDFADYKSGWKNTLLTFLYAHSGYIVGGIFILVSYLTFSYYFSFSLTSWLPSLFRRNEQQPLERVLEGNLNHAARINEAAQANAQNIAEVSASLNTHVNNFNNFVAGFANNNLDPAQIRDRFTVLTTLLRRLQTTVNQDHNIISRVFPFDPHDLTHLVPVFEDTIRVMAAVSRRIGGIRTFPGRGQRLGRDGHPSSSNSNNNNNNNDGLE